METDSFTDPGLAVEEDLWGRICTDCYEQGAARFAMRRDDGWVEDMEAAPYFRTELSGLEVEVLSRVRGHVLDIGCGPGADVLWLQERGTRVTGIDLSAGAIAVARRRGAQDVHALSLWDLARLGTSFDTVLLFGNTLGLAGSPEKMAQFLELLRAHTRPGAALIGQTMNPRVTAVAEHQAYHRRNEAAGRYCGQVRIREEYAGRAAPWFDLVFFEGEILAPLLARHGWQWQETIPCGHSYVVVAEKG